MSKKAGEEKQRDMESVGIGIKKNFHAEHTETTKKIIKRGEIPRSQRARRISKVATTGVLLLRHGGRVMADDEPLRAIPAVGEAVACRNLLAGSSEVEGIKAVQGCDVAGGVEVMGVEPAARLVCQKMAEVLHAFLFG